MKKLLKIILFLSVVGINSASFADIATENLPWYLENNDIKVCWWDKGVRG